MKVDLNKIRQELINGNQDWLAEVYSSTKEYCYSYLIKSKLCSLEDAEDIFIEAIMILRRRIMDQSLDSLQNVKTFLVGVCINLNKDKRTRNNKHQSREQNVLKLFYGMGEEDTLGDEEEFLLQKNIAEEALNSLGPQCQDIIRMFHFDRLTMAEIAKALEFKSANVAKTLKSRCLKKLVDISHKIKDSRS